MSIHGHLAIGIAAASWLAWAYWSVSYVRTTNVLVRWIDEHDPGFWSRDVPDRNSKRAQSYYRPHVLRIEWIVLFTGSRRLPKDESFQDNLGDARWAVGLAVVFWAIAIVATGILSLPR